MSRTVREDRFHCSNDCRQTGCPGHTLKVEQHHTSDTVTVYEDGQRLMTFDKTQFAVMCRLGGRET